MNRRARSPRRCAPAFLVVVAALHFVHCPSVTTGPGTGCAPHQSDTIGRLFPVLPSRANVLFVRIDETENAIVPSAVFVARYEPPPVSPLGLLPQLGVGDCTCVRDDDGKRCDSTEAVVPPAVDGGVPQACENLRILGIGAHRPVFGAPTCVVDSECAMGEVCFSQACSRPHVLAFDAAAQRHVADPMTIDPQLLNEGSILTIEMTPTPTTIEDPPQCPAEQKTFDIRFLQRTALLAPSPGAAVPRSAPLAIRWTGTGASFVLVQVRGTRAGVRQTVACRPIDRTGDEQAGFDVPASTLAELGAGAGTVELYRINAAQTVVARLDSANAYVISTRVVPVTLE